MNCVHSLQSFATDEAFAAGEAQLLFTPKRVRRSHWAEHEPTFGSPALQHQLNLGSAVSLSMGGSQLDLHTIRPVSSKQQEEWDEEIPEISFARIIR